MTDLLLQKIEQFLKGELSGQALKEFEQKLKNDSSFYKNVLAQKHINKTLENSSFSKFVQVLNKVEAEFYQKENQYTLDQLLEMFGVVEEYEKELVLATTRSDEKGLIVLSPKNGIDGNDEISFTLDQAVGEDLNLIIENTTLYEVADLDFPAFSDTLKVSTKLFLPGRYYWKLISDSYHTAWGFFFVKKKLMPL